MNVDKIVEMIKNNIDRSNEEFLGNDMFRPASPNRWCLNKDSSSWLSVNSGFEEIEVLNPIDDVLAEEAIKSGALKSGVGDDTVKSMRNYLFEMDEASLEEQRQYIDKLKGKVINRSVFSGSKSYHNRITINSPEKISKEEYHFIWKCLNKLFFDDKADAQCKNPSRRTRVGNAYRKDKKCGQDVLVNNDNILYCYNFFHEKWLDKNKEEEKERIRIIKETKRRQKLNLSNKKSSVINNKKIRYYLDTPFTRESGNGDSNRSLYVAICVCLTADDDETLNIVLDKARSERWTKKELDDKIKRARQRR
jgi:hypothetical protein